MKKYENPSLEVKQFSIIDVISTSGVEKEPDTGNVNSNPTTDGMEGLS